MAGGVTVLYRGLVGLGVTGALVVLTCLVGFVGFVNCLTTGLDVLADVVLEIVDFEGLTLDNCVLEATALTEFTLGLVGVAFDDRTLGLGDAFLAVVGCGFFGAASWVDRAESGFVLKGLVLRVAEGVDFFLLSVLSVVFLGLLEIVGFGVGGLGVFFFGILEEEKVVGLAVGGCVGVALVLSGGVTVSILALRGGVAKPSCTVTGITVGSSGVGTVPGLGFIVLADAEFLTAEAAAATLLARLNFVGFLAVSGLLCLGVATVAVMFVSRGMIGSRGERLGLYVSASLHCFLMYLQ